MLASTSQQDEASRQTKRSACDRCHDQKLRCTRLQEDMSCIRCVKARVNCNSSVAQRTGRPRKITTVGMAPEKGYLDGDNKRKSPRNRTGSSESTPPIISCSFRETPDFSIALDQWHNFRSSSSSSISSASMTPQQYNGNISTDDFTDMLNYIHDQPSFACIDNSYLPDYATCFLDMHPHAQSSTGLSPFQKMDMSNITPAADATMRQIDQAHCQTLVSLYSEIDVYMERITPQANRMCNGSNIYSTEIQRLSEALGDLLSTAERFIELITCISRTVDNITSGQSLCLSPSPSINSWGPPSPFTTPQKESTQSHLSNKTYKDRQTNSLDSSMLTSGRQLSASTFHTMLKCHIELLSAYDMTLDIMSSRLLDFENIDAGQPLTGALSIGSFVVPFGAIIETLLHLQVISHQLDRLKIALHRILPLQPPPAIRHRRSPPTQVTRGTRTGSPSINTVEYKLEDIQDREHALHTKLLHIEARAGSSKHGHFGERNFPSRW